MMWTHFTVISLGLVAFSSCSSTGPPTSLEVGASVDLAAHSAEFKQEVIKVTEGVYVAIGFGLANSILLEGSDGVIIVDTMESMGAAVPVKKAFNRITTNGNGGQKWRRVAVEECGTGFMISLQPQYLSRFSSFPPVGYYFLD
jgi:hypothetical protein